MGLMLILLAGASAIGYILLQTKKSSFIYSDYGVKIPSEYPLLGIDVSHHQGAINYEETMEMGSGTDSIQFVYIKATEGSDFRDSRYDRNAEGFAKGGMNYGFYHYYIPHESAEEQALFYCETVKNYNFKLVPVLDIEVIGDLTPKALVDSIGVFMNKVESVLETRPMIYTYSSFYRDYLRNTTLKSELYWLASYSRKNEFMDQENVIIWQFSEKGNVNGIGEKVDLNVAKLTFNHKVIVKR